MKFEWNKDKNTINKQKHGISFENAVRVFADPYYIDLYDERSSGINPYGVWEDRYAAIGYVNDVLYVVYTIRSQDDDEIYRIISARPAEPKEIGEYLGNRRWNI